MKKWMAMIVLFGSMAMFYSQGGLTKESTKTVHVIIDEEGMKPSEIRGVKGQELILLVTRKTDKTCVTSLKNVNGVGETSLPMNKEVRFVVGKLEKSGEIQLLCGMDMKSGVIQVL